jgi:chromosome segregation ATPase
MSLEAHYEQLVIEFEPKRRELLAFTASVVPKPTDRHRREWRIKQLDNAIADMKTTIAAANLQLDEERVVLEELNNEYDRLQGQSRKLTEDVKMLEGVSGVPAVMPCDADTDVMKEILSFSEHFRTAFAEFYFDQTAIKQELPADPTLERDAKILIASLRDYTILQFDHRAMDAALSKDIDDKTAEGEALRQKIKAEEARLQKELTSQRQRIEQSAVRMRDSIQDQGRQLLKQGRKIRTELQTAQDEMKQKVGELEGKARRLKLRVSGLISQNRAVKQNFKHRSMLLEEELDRLENRIDSIKQHPCVVDKKLVNISLILSKKSKLINAAIAEIRQEIADFNRWVRDSV